MDSGVFSRFRGAEVVVWFRHWWFFAHCCAGLCHNSAQCVNKENKKNEKSFALRPNANECDAMGMEKAVNVRVPDAVYDRIKEIAASRLGGVKPAVIVREILEQAMIDGILSKIPRRQGSTPENPSKLPQGRKSVIQ